MSWRPEGWRTGDVLQKARDIFEAGADAILEALKEKGAYMTPEQMKLLAPDRQYPYGYLVLYPRRSTLYQKNNRYSTENIRKEENE